MGDKTRDKICFGILCHKQSFLCAERRQSQADSIISKQRLFNIIQLLLPLLPTTLNIAKNACPRTLNILIKNYIFNTAHVAACLNVFIRVKMSPRDAYDE